jgi:hypothetical protein
MRIKIGTWQEKESRKLTEHTSYAADHIEVETVPGVYDLFVDFVGGYLIPMPYWLLTSIPANVVGGGYYSGFGGVNFAFTPAKTGPTHHGVQLYAYQLKGAVEAGYAIVDPEWQWLVVETPSKAAHERGITWESLKASALAQVG